MRAMPQFPRPQVGIAVGAALLLAVAATLVLGIVPGDVLRAAEAGAHTLAAPPVQTTAYGAHDRASNPRLADVQSTRVCDQAACGKAHCQVQNMRIHIVLNDPCARCLSHARACFGVADQLRTASQMASG